MPAGWTVVKAALANCRHTYCFFFFQAEDGIRDLTVTGVQTCALPIYSCADWQDGTFPVWDSFTTLDKIFALHYSLRAEILRDRLDASPRFDRRGFAKRDRKSVV